MKKIVALASAAVLGLGLAACDSGTENAAEEQADVVEESMEAEANVLEDQGQEAQADALEDQADATGDALEDQADTIDSGTPE
jgi:uncharacterized protein YcfL